MKRKICFFTLVISLVVFCSCVPKTANSPNNSILKGETSINETKKFKANITLFIFGKALSEKEVIFNKGEKLFDVLKKNYDLKSTDGMITSINGQAQDEKNSEYWIFTINDEQVNFGAKDVVLKDGDRVVFKLEKF